MEKEVSFGRRPESDKLAELVGTDNFSEMPRLSNSQLIRLFDEVNLLKDYVSYGLRFKRKLLKNLGYTFIPENNTNMMIQVNVASPETVHDQVRAAYYEALREEGMISIEPDFKYS